MILKDLITLEVIFNEVHLKNSQKEWMKQCKLNDCKVKIFENLDEFDILTKDSI